jgi:6-phosphogluconolactonase
MAFNNYTGANPKAVVEHLIIDWIESVSKMLESKPEVYIALSGGNTPQLLFEILARTYSRALPWNKLHFFWVDERWVPFESPESNYGNAKRLLFDHIEIDNSNIHPIRVSELSPKDEASRYENEIVGVVPLINKYPVFDIIFLGMGDDGHTASIFPGNEYLFNDTNICVVTKHPQTAQIRLTLTGKAINMSKNIIFLITGDKKANVLKIVFEDKYRIYPVQFIRPVNGNLFWYLDREAGRFISKYL